jgi:hypothetical protein
MAPEHFLLHHMCPLLHPPHLSARSLGTASPKNTTSGFSTPPQELQGGTTKALPASATSTSPSGRLTGICRWQAHSQPHNQDDALHTCLQA